MARIVELQMPESRWRHFQDRLRNQRRVGNEETLGFLLCRPVWPNGRRVILCPEELIVPDAADLLMVSTCGIGVSPAWQVRHLVPHLLARRILVQVHSHPGGGTPVFSSIDTANEQRYARFLGRLPHGSRRYFVSCVLNQQLERPVLRCWASDGSDRQTRVNLNLEGVNMDERMDRQRVFGDGFRQALDPLRVCLSGCGGVGAVFAEQLSRLGVRHWTLIDADHIETSNLNRLPATSMKDAECRRMKVDHVEDLVRRFWGDQADVESLVQPLEKVDLPAILGRCDWLVLATDSHSSRLNAQLAARDTGVRILNLGTLIDRREDQTRMMCRVTLLPSRGAGCLVCNRSISAEQAAREEASPAVRTRLKEAGYLDQVSAPAVYWLNSLCASMGVGVLHRCLTEEGLPEGRDWILDPLLEQWHRLPFPDSDCFYCGDREDLPAAAWVPQPLHNLLDEGMHLEPRSTIFCP